MPIVIPDLDSTAPLVTTARAAYNAQLAQLLTANSALLSELIDAASGAIVRYCNRDFWSTAYTDYYSGSGERDVLKLRRMPVLQVTRIATNPMLALAVANTSTGVQRATVATTATALLLTRVASGVSTSNTLAFATYATVDLLAAAVTAVGNGWTASSQNGLGSFPSADLTPLQGAVTAKNGNAYVEMHTEEPSTMWDGDDGLWTGNATAWRLDAGPGIIWGRFPRGRLNIRVDYTAGYAEIPADVQEATVQLVLDLYNSEVRDQTQSTGGLGPTSFTNITSHMSPKVKGLLATYRDISNTIAR